MITTTNLNPEYGLVFKIEGAYYINKERFESYDRCMMCVKHNGLGYQERNVRIRQLERISRGKYIIKKLSQWVKS